MIKAIISDFSRVILYPAQPDYVGGLNDLYQEVKTQENFDFWTHFQLNTDLLKFYKSIKTKHQFYIFTTGTLQNDPALKTFLFPLFTQIFSTAETGWKKNDPNAFKLLTGKIGQDPHDVLFIDDSQPNIHAAEIAGLKTHRFQKNALLKQYYTDFIEPLQ